MTVNKWQLTERLSNEELIDQLKIYDEEYAGSLVLHVESGVFYVVTDFGILSHNSIAEYSVNYHPYSRANLYTAVKHNRPAREFFDGRFQFISKTEEK